MARPTKANDQRKAAIVLAVEQGNTREVAARANGIGESTLYEWIAKDSEFAEDIKNADASAERSAVTAIRSADDWKALAWWLERTRPEKYARRDPLGEQQLREAVERGRRAFLAELEAELAELTPAARRVLMGAMARAAARKELTP